MSEPHENVAIAHAAMVRLSGQVSQMADRIVVLETIAAEWRTQEKTLVAELVNAVEIYCAANADAGCKTVDVTEVSCQRCTAIILVPQGRDAKEHGWCVPSDGHLRLCPSCVAAHKREMKAATA